MSATSALPVMSLVSVRRESLTENRLLSAMPPEVNRQILKNSEIVTLSFGDVLCEHDKKLHNVYFPLNCLVSLVVSIDDRAPFELAMVGPEGMIGASEVLGVNTAPMQAIVQSKGQAAKMTSQNFRTLLLDVPILNSTVKLFLFDLMEEIIKTAGCSQFHILSSRLARWLLTAADRAGNDSCTVTQQTLSEFLGVKRSAISIAASFLQEKKLISYSRGLITILDRDGLEAESCSCYAETAWRQDRA